MLNPKKAIWRNEMELTINFDKFQIKETENTEKETICGISKTGIVKSLKEKLGRNYTSKESGSGMDLLIEGGFYRKSPLEIWTYDYEEMTILIKETGGEARLEIVGGNKKLRQQALLSFFQEN